MQDNKPIGLTIAQISETLKRMSNHYLKSENLTFSQTRFLDYLHSHRNEKKIKVKDIEDYFNLQHSTAVGILQRLEKKHFIVTEKDTEDNRCRLIKRTDEGIKLQERIEISHKKMDELFVKNMSKDEAEELHRLLIILLANLKEVQNDK